MKRTISLILAFLFIFSASAPLALAYTVPPDTVVYVTPSGKKYHREGCSYISGSARAMTIEEAVSKGKGACSRCHPDILTGPYTSSGKSSGNSGESGGTTSPNFPDEYEPSVEVEPLIEDEPPVEPELAVESESPAVPPVSSSKLSIIGSMPSWLRFICLAIISVVLYFWLFPMVVTCLILSVTFVVDLFRKKPSISDLKEKLRMEFKNTKKVNRLRALLSKGYCNNPYTGLPMSSIDDFIEYVERLNKEVDNMRKDGK